MIAILASRRMAAGLLIAAGFLVAATSGLQAQPSAAPGRGVAKPAPPPAEVPPMVVGIIDIGAVLHDSTAAQDLQHQMQLQQDSYQADFEKEQRELRSAEEEIERERSSLSADIYGEKRRVFQERVNKAAVDFRNRRRRLEDAFNVANGQITKALMAAIDELAVKNGVSVVLRREAVLYQKNAIDLTQPAIALLNARLPSVSIVLPPS